MRLRVFKGKLNVLRVLSDCEYFHFYVVLRMIRYLIDYCNHVAMNHRFAELLLVRQF